MSESPSRTHSVVLGISMAETAYEAYRAHTGGKSLATGADIPPFADLPLAIKDAWAASARAVMIEYEALPPNWPLDAP